MYRYLLFTLLLLRSAHSITFSPDISINDALGGYGSGPVIHFDMDSVGDSIVDRVGGYKIRMLDICTNPDDIGWRTGEHYLLGSGAALNRSTANGVTECNAATKVTVACMFDAESTGLQMITTYGLKTTANVGKYFALYYENNDIKIIWPNQWRTGSITTTINLDQLPNWANIPRPFPIIISLDFDNDLYRYNIAGMNVNYLYEQLGYTTLMSPGSITNCPGMPDSTNNAICIGNMGGSYPIDSLTKIGHVAYYEDFLTSWQQINLAFEMWNFLPIFRSDQSFSYDYIGWNENYHENHSRYWMNSPETETGKLTPFPSITAISPKASTYGRENGNFSPWPYICDSLGRSLAAPNGQNKIICVFGTNTGGTANLSSSTGQKHLLRRHRIRVADASGLAAGNFIKGTTSGVIDSIVSISGDTVLCDVSYRGGPYPNWYSTGGTGENVVEYTDKACTQKTNDSTTYTASSASYSSVTSPYGTGKTNSGTSGIYQRLLAQMQVYNGRVPYILYDNKPNDVLHIKNGGTYADVYDGISTFHRWIETDLGRNVATIFTLYGHADNIVDSQSVYDYNRAIINYTKSNARAYVGASGIGKSDLAEIDVETSVNAYRYLYSHWYWKCFESDGSTETGAYGYVGSLAGADSMSFKAVLTNLDSVVVPDSGDSIKFYTDSAFEDAAVYLTGASAGDTILSVVSDVTASQQLHPTPASSINLLAKPTTETYRHLLGERDTAIRFPEFTVKTGGYNTTHRVLGNMPWSSTTEDYKWGWSGKKADGTYIIADTAVKTDNEISVTFAEPVYNVLRYYFNPYQTLGRTWDTIGGEFQFMTANTADTNLIVGGDGFAMFPLIMDGSSNYIGKYRPQGRHSLLRASWSIRRRYNLK